jgi:hypothetical protein
MAHEPERKVELRRWYLSGLTMQTAAERAGVPIDTARRWKREAKDGGDDWDRQRGAALLANGSADEVLSRVLAVTISQAETTLEALGSDATIDAMARVQATVSLADSLNKMVAASRRLMPETDALAVRLDTLKRLAEFCREKYPKAAAVLVEVLEAFGAEVARS